MAPTTQFGRDLLGAGIEITLVTMNTVSVPELKANLGRYLSEARRGGEVLVLDEGTPVARLVPPVAIDDLSDRERLIRMGILRPGNGSAAAILDEPPLELPTSISEALSED